jgi:hypothetical protein
VRGLNEVDLETPERRALAGLHGPDARFGHALATADIGRRARAHEQRARLHRDDGRVEGVVEMRVHRDYRRERRYASALERL